MFDFSRFNSQLVESLRVEFCEAATFPAKKKKKKEGKMNQMSRLITWLLLAVYSLGR